MGELKHLSTPRKRNNSRSSGERTGKQPKPYTRDSLPALCMGCCKTHTRSAVAALNSYKSRM